MALQDTTELMRLRNSFHKTPLAPGQSHSRLLDLLEDLSAPFIIVALSLVVMTLGLAQFARHLLTTAFQMLIHAAGQLG